MTWLTVILGLWLLWAACTLYRFSTNYLVARKTGLPLIFLPLNNYNVIWMVLSVPIIHPLAEKYFPAWMFEGVDLGTYGWEFRNGYSIFEKHGPAFVLVTGGYNELSLCDPELATEVLKHVSDFPQTHMAAVILDIFGTNLLSSTGEKWQRQRKLIAPNINEKISGLVFGESARQAHQMLSSHMDDLKGVTHETAKGMKEIAINVLAVAGFGITVPWGSEKSQPQKGQRMTYMGATKIVVENVIEAALLPAKLLTLPIFGPSWQDIGHAKKEFPIRTKEMFDNERRLQQESCEPRTNLMSMLVRLTSPSDVEGDSHAKSEDVIQKPQVLQEEEIAGNLFVFTSAGFDTTANTMAYALALLAAHPQWQEWIYEEIREIVGDRDATSLQYNDVYPRLPRCLALMLETLRLFTPLTHVAKESAKHEVKVTTTARNYLIPPSTTIYISTVAIHLDPHTWGTDAPKFNPSRWLVDPSLTPSSTNSAYTIADNIKNMPRGTFLPWSSGPRVCPGQKMAQVEFVSVFMTIFSRFRCEAVRVSKTETDQEVTKRLEGIMMNSAPKLTLQMSRNQDLKIRWIMR